MYYLRSDLTAYNSLLHNASSWNNIGALGAQTIGTTCMYVVGMLAGAKILSMVPEVCSWLIPGGVSSGAGSAAAGVAAVAGVAGVSAAAGAATAVGVPVAGSAVHAVYNGAVNGVSGAATGASMVSNNGTIASAAGKVGGAIVGGIGGAAAGVASSIGHDIGSAFKGGKQKGK